MDPTEFKRASQNVWDAMAPGWDRRSAYMEERARPVTEKMLERLAPKPGDQVLELAAGNGLVGFAAAALVGPKGRVLISDFSQGMVDVAARQAEKLGLEQVQCRRLDAEKIELPDAAFDGVLCRWGYMLMADPSGALGETRRVLRRGGRLSAAVFAGPQQNPWAAVPSRVLQQRGHMPPQQAGGPGILALGDRDRLRKLFTDAGFSEPRIDEVPFTWDFNDLDDYWDFLAGAAGAIAMVIARLDEGEKRQVREDLAENVTPFVRAGRIELPAVSNVAVAW